MIAAALPAVVHAATSGTPRVTSNSAVRKPVVAQTSAKSATRPAIGPKTRTPAAFTREMPLSEAIDILRTCTTPPLNIIVLWRDLDSAGIYRDTPIGIDGLPGLRVGQYLDLLVLSLSAGATDKIDYAIRGGVITVATTRALPVARQMARVYDIRDLTAPPATYSFPPIGFGGVGPGYGLGSSYLPGGSWGATGLGSLSGRVGNSYGMRMR